MRFLLGCTLLVVIRVCIAIDFPVMVGVLLWVPAYVAALVLFGLVPKSRGRGGSSSYSSSSYSDDGEEG